MHFTYEYMWNRLISSLDWGSILSYFVLHAQILHIPEDSRVLLVSGISSKGYSARTLIPSRHTAALCSLWSEEPLLLFFWVRGRQTFAAAVCPPRFLLPARSRSSNSPRLPPCEVCIASGSIFGLARNFCSDFLIYAASCPSNFTPSVLLLGRAESSSAAAHGKKVEPSTPVKDGHFHI